MRPEPSQDSARGERVHRHKIRADAPRTEASFRPSSHLRSLGASEALPPKQGVGAAGPDFNSPSPRGGGQGVGAVSTCFPKAHAPSRVRILPEASGYIGTGFEPMRPEPRQASARQAPSEVWVRAKRCPQAGKGVEAPLLFPPPHGEGVRGWGQFPYAFPKHMPRDESGSCPRRAGTSAQDLSRCAPSRVRILPEASGYIGTGFEPMRPEPSQDSARGKRVYRHKI